jgi:hypothetical protein
VTAATSPVTAASVPAHYDSGMAVRALVSRRTACAYFAVQAVTVVAWWVLLAALPAARPLFRPAGAPDVALFAFAPGDLLMLGLGSAAVALWSSRRDPTLGAAAWLVAGATAYAALYTITLAACGAMSAVGACLMTPAALASLACARALDHG